MGITGRIVDLWRSRHAPDDEELQDRLDETYRTQLGHLQSVRRGVADVATSRKRVEVRMAALDQDVAALDATSREAVDRGDDAAARTALTRKVEIEDAADDLRERHAALLAEERDLTRTADELERRIEDFRMRKDTLAARHSAATARAEVTSAESGITSSMSDVNRAMADAERHTRQLEAKADAVDELVADGVIERPGESADLADQRRFDAALENAGTEESGGDGDGPHEISR